MPDGDVEYFERKQRMKVWAAEFITTGRLPNLSGEKPDPQYKLEHYLEEQEAAYQFRKWETTWLAEHIEREGYTQEEIPELLIEARNRILARYAQTGARIRGLPTD